MNWISGPVKFIRTFQWEDPSSTILLFCVAIQSLPPHKHENFAGWVNLANISREFYWIVTRFLLNWINRCQLNCNCLWTLTQVKAARSEFYFQKICNIHTVLLSIYKEWKLPSCSETWKPQKVALVKGLKWFWVEINFHAKNRLVIVERSQVKQWWIAETKATA